MIETLQATQDLCPECGNYQLLPEMDRGSVVCTICGLVVCPLIDTSPGYIHQSHQNLVYPYLDNNLITQISPQKYDTNGNRLSTEILGAMHRLRYLDDSFTDNKDRNQRKAMFEIKRVCGQLRIGLIQQDIIARYYKKALYTGLLSKLTIHTTVAALVYLIAKQGKYIITLSDIYRVSRSNPKEIRKIINILRVKLGLRSPPIHPKHLIERFGTVLQISRKTQLIAYDLIRQAEAHDLIAGRNPSSVASGVLYAAGHLSCEFRSMKQVADATQCCEFTIRNRMKELNKCLNLNISTRKRGGRKRRRDHV